MLHGHTQQVYMNDSLELATIAKAIDAIVQ
jgi:hypothetical protein